MTRHSRSSNQVILWNTHGGYDSFAGPIICTGEELNTNRFLWDPVYYLRNAGYTCKIQRDVVVSEDGVTIANLIHVTGNRSYNNEDALQSAICLVYLYAVNEYTIVREMAAGKGFADVVFIPYKPDIPAMIIELKRNGSTDSAIKQIREKQYQ